MSSPSPVSNDIMNKKDSKVKIENKKPNFKSKTNIPISPRKACPCSVYQILAIVIPISFVQLFMIIFLSVYLTKNKRKEKIIAITDNNITDTTNVINEINLSDEEYDNFTIIIKNFTYATLTPKNGYDHIYIHLGGITEVAGFFSNFFSSKKTFIPKGTKIYYLSGKFRKTKYVEKTKIGSIFDELMGVPSWFNVDENGNLICENCNGDDFAEAKESLNLILDEIDRISKDESIDYDKIYLGGFSQGGIMVNYALLNSRHKLGGYLAFSGYVLDHHFPPNTVVTELNDEQKQILNAKKDYHILAAHSFNDESVPYSRIIEGYYTYYQNYTDFKLLSFGKLGHEFDNQPTHPYVRKWLKESMGK